MNKKNRHSIWKYLLSAVIVVEPLQHLLHLGRQQHRRPEAMRCIQSVVQILDVQVDLEAGLEVAGKNHRSFGFHHGAACKPAADRIEYELGIDAGLGRQHERFGHGSDIERNDDLVRQFGSIACADFAAPDDRLAHFSQ